MSTEAISRGERPRRHEDLERSSTQIHCWISKRPTVLCDPRQQLSSGQIPFWGAKRARSMLGDQPLPAVSSPCHPKWRDWSNLGDGPAGLIADCLLANDVADHISFRAVCRPWRQCSTDPHTHGILDRRFHPRKWIMLREAFSASQSQHCRLLNVSTGQCIRMHLPELRGHDVFGSTNEGLLVLLDRTSYVVRLLNPLTRQVTNLPPATTLLRLSASRYENAHLREAFEVSDAGLASDSTFAVFFRGIHMLAVAKPGDECWTLVDKEKTLWTAISFEGRFYCTTNQGVMVVETSSYKEEPPQLVMAAKMTKVFSPMSTTVHLVDNNGELLLMYRTIRQRLQYDDDDCHDKDSGDGNARYFIEYNAYQVDLKAMNAIPILGLGGRAIFIGLKNALSVSPSVFPSIKNNSIYVGVDDLLGASLESNRVHSLMDGTTEHCGILVHDDECSSSGMHQFGPWGISDYLRWYVTESYDDSEPDD